MCVILHCVTSKPTEEILKKCENANADGMGISYYRDGKLYMEKGITIERMNEIVAKENLPFGIHFRISTVGGKRPELCHPFHIAPDFQEQMAGESSYPLLFHNGHVANYEYLLLLACFTRGIKYPSIPMSDSRVVAMGLHYIGNAYLNEHSTSKFLIFNPDGTQERFGSGWSEEGGIFYSNTSWKFSYRGSYGYGYNSRDDDWYYDNGVYKPIAKDKSTTYTVGTKTNVTCKDLTKTKKEAPPSVDKPKETLIPQYKDSYDFLAQKKWSISSPGTTKTCQCDECKSNIPYTYTETQKTGNGTKLMLLVQDEKNEYRTVIMGNQFTHEHGTVETFCWQCL